MEAKNAEQKYCEERLKAIRPREREGQSFIQCCTCRTTLGITKEEMEAKKTERKKGNKAKKKKRTRRRKRTETKKAVQRGNRTGANTDEWTVNERGKGNRKDTGLVNERGKGPTGKTQG